MSEAKYQRHLKAVLENTFPDCVVLKNDPEHFQGLPDLLILFYDKWAALEVKVSRDAHRQPNQQYYIDMFDQMSFAAFIYPENEEEIINELREAFRN